MRNDSPTAPDGAGSRRIGTDDIATDLLRSLTRLPIMVEDGEEIKGRSAFDDSLGLPSAHPLSAAAHPASLRIRPSLHGCAHQVEPGAEDRPVAGARHLRR